MISCPLSTSIGSLILILYQSTVAVIRCAQRMLEGRIEHETRSVRVTLLALEARVARERQHAADLGEVAGIRVEHRGVVGAPGVDLRRAQLLQLRAVRVADLVRLRQVLRARWSRQGSVPTPESCELTVGVVYELGDVRRALRAVVATAESQPGNRFPAQLRFVRGHVLPGGVLGIAATQLQLEVADAPGCP